MHSNRIAAGVVAGALALAGAASAQVNTTCQVVGQQLYCNSTAPSPYTTTFGTGYGAQTIILPAQAQQMAAEAQLATIRAQRAQAELDAYRQRQAQEADSNDYRTARGQAQYQADQRTARANAFAAKLVRCSEANPTDAGYRACMGGETAP